MSFDLVHKRRLSRLSQSFFTDDMGDTKSRGTFEVKNSEASSSMSSFESDTMHFSKQTPVSLMHKLNIPSATSKEILKQRQIHRRIACCHFMELILFMFAFLWIIWLHEVEYLLVSILISVCPHLSPLS